MPLDVASDQVDVASDQASPDFCISTQQNSTKLESDGTYMKNYKAKGDDERDEGDYDKDDNRTEGDNDKDDDIGSIELSQFDEMLAEVAADSLQWLMHKLGPLLATKYIIRPLLDGLYRCFTSHYSNQEVAVLKCLSHFVSTYGHLVVMKMFIPHAESLVSNTVLVYLLCSLVRLKLLESNYITNQKEV